MINPARVSAPDLVQHCRPAKGFARAGGLGHHWQAASVEGASYKPSSPVEEGVHLREQLLGFTRSAASRPLRELFSLLLAAATGAGGGATGQAGGASGDQDRAAGADRAVRGPGLLLRLYLSRYDDLSHRVASSRSPLPGYPYDPRV